MSKDLAIVPVAVAPSPATSGTTLKVLLTDINSAPAGASIIPETYPVSATIAPANQRPTRVNSEIITITGASDDATHRTYTIVRAQGVPVTVARTILPTDEMIFGLSATEIDGKVNKSIMTTKGDLLAATASATPARVAVGTNDYVLMADSTAASGVAWKAPGSISMVSSEVPSGSINSSNTAFTLASTPVTGSVKIYLNGIRLKVTEDYTISGTVITMNVAPVTGDLLLADYMISSGTFATGSASWTNNEVPSGTVNSSNTSFTLVSSPVSGSLMLFMDGQLLKDGGNDFTLSGNTITFVEAPLTGSVLLAFYQSAVSTAGNADLLDGFHGNGYIGTPNTFVPDNFGWQAINATLTYASATTITSNVDLTAFIQKGDKLKITQTTAKYFYVVSITSTTITVTGGSDYSVANAAITSPFVSKIENPQGFPSFFNWIPTLTSGNADLSGYDVAIFSINKTLLTLNFDASNRSLSGTAGQINISLPVTPSAGTSNRFGSCSAYPIAAAYSMIRGAVSGTDLILYKGMTSETWAATETGLYIQINASYYI